MSSELLSWVVFAACIGLLLVLDLGVFHRKSHVVQPKEALVWTLIWISVSLLFNVGILVFKGYEPAIQFLTGYLIEKSLSIDNIFVFAIIFSYFHVPAIYKHRILFWGIIGALIMRGLMIWFGVILLTRFHWITYLFGLALIFTAIKLLLEKKESEHLDQRLIVTMAKKFIPMVSQFHDHHFFIYKNGWKATPMFIVLIVVESTDLIFAIDSIPAIFAITEDPFIIYTSNIFAVLGLRSLYFLLANVLNLFHYLKHGLSAILCFVGLKMLIVPLYVIPALYSLFIILLILTISITISLLFPPNKSW